MPTTAIDLSLGLNLEVGSVPIALKGEVQTDGDGETVYVFGGSVQEASIDIGRFLQYVGQQFGVDVELPAELNLGAQIDYIAGQLRHTAPKSGTGMTELGVLAKFDLIYARGSEKKTFSFNFYADTVLASGAGKNAYVVGAAIDTDLAFGNLPLVGSIPVLRDYSLKHLGFSYTNIDPASLADKAVTFTIPQVIQTANPLKPDGAPTTRESSVYAISTKGDQTELKLDRKGFAFTAGLVKRGSAHAERSFSLPMALPSADSRQSPAAFNAGSGDTKTTRSASPVHWIDIDRKFGPVDLRKIGLNYQGGAATFGFSAGIEAGGLSLELQRLAITFPLPLPHVPAGGSVRFDLDGLAVNFQKGGLSIGGGFVRAIENGVTNYFGEVAVQVANYGFKAIGGYAPAQNGHPASFFLYANLNIPLGGPPFLYVSALAFGFGINYALNLPTIDNLAGYLLLPNRAPRQPAKPGGAFGPTGVLTQLSAGSTPVISNDPGQHWVAAGVQFTSFNMVSAFAVVTVSFGVETQVGLIGSCSIALPKGASSPLAYIEVDLVASFRPSSGLLYVAGVLTPASYVFGDFVKITGGFAFCLWFGGDHNGDFVVSLGGYHPAYRKPAWYPSVPRLRLSYVMGAFEATGSAYLALTPAMFMAGMQFSAQFSTGNVRAWFNAGIDFLVSWAPFFYLADAYVNIGCSVDLGLFTVSVSVGADLQVWGPRFGGRADVDLDIVSFTIHFGADRPNPPALNWEQLERNFLPDSSTRRKERPRARSLKMARLHAAAPLAAPAAGNSEKVSASAAGGLAECDVTDTQGRVWNWIIDGNDFELVTTTQIPANAACWTTAPGKTAAVSSAVADYGRAPQAGLPQLSVGDPNAHFSDQTVWNPTLHVKPMKLRNVTSRHTITLTKANADGVFDTIVPELKIQPRLENSNTALWGDPNAAVDPNAAALMPSTLVGFSLLPLPRNPNTTSSVRLIQLLYTQGNKTTFRYTAPQVDRTFALTLDPLQPTYALTIHARNGGTHDLSNRGYVLNSLADPWVKSRRRGVLDDLSTEGFGTYPASDVTLTRMASTEKLTDWPLVGVLGAAAAAAA